LRRVRLAPLTVDGQPGSPLQTLPCDLLVMAVGSTPANGLLYQAGARIAYDEDAGQFVVEALPPGVFAAGRVTGRLGDDAAAAGREAAAFALGQNTASARQPHNGHSLPAPCYRPTTGKAFVCLCEDIAAKDIATAVAEGFDSLELVKRYATVTMGPCQGKMCAVASIHLTAAATGRAIAATGVTTARPPLTPVPLGVLAGRPMEPLRRTPVDAWHRRHGARMLVAGLWHRPEHYGDPVAEIQAVRQAVGLIDVSTLGKLRLTGPGVPAFLDRLYTTRLGDLPIGRVRYGLMCNDEGVVLDDGVTARLGDQEWYTTTTTGNAEAIYEWMQWWAQAGWGEGVHITDVTEDFAAFNLAGPQARAVLQRLTDADVSNEAFPYLHVRAMAVAGVPCRVLRIGFTGELSYEIHCPAGWGLFLWEALLEAGAAYGIRPFGVEAQRVLRLEKAHLIIGQDTDAMSDPLSAGMAWAVRFEKPDFLGRRSLLRVKTQGLRQQLVGFEVLTPGVTPEEGLQIVAPNGDGRPTIIGWVTSSRYSPTLGKAIGLCWLPADLAAQPGAVFTIHRDGGPVQARVHHGPFYDPAGTRLRG
jgi:sarcosine oxidase subunit alpha